MSGLMTQKKLDEAIKLGLGQGREESYKSWIRIRRNLHSTVSRLQTLHVPLYMHQMHLISGLERDAAHVGLWLGADEVREQFPFWPFEHAHPATGLHHDLDRHRPRVRGLLEIARDAGIDHGVYVGTKIPFVATMDLMWGLGPWADRRLVSWSCKPREFLDDVENRRRMHERISLERLYCAEVDARHVLIDGRQWTDQFIKNLRWLQPLRSEVADQIQRRRVADFGGKFMSVADRMTVEAAKAYAGKAMSMNTRESDDHFRAAVWFGHIDLDLRRAVVMTRPLRRDEDGFKESLRVQLFGGAR